MVLAIKENDFDPLIKIFGENESLRILKNIDEHIRLITNNPSEIRYFPIPLFLSDMSIYKNHYQIAAYIICGVSDVSIIYKKIGEPQAIDYTALGSLDRANLEPYLNITA